MTTLFDPWADARVRRCWLNGMRLKVRTATAPKSMRLDWPDGGIVAVGFAAKSASQSSVAVGHARLPDRETAAHLSTPRCARRRIAVLSRSKNLHLDSQGCPLIVMAP